MSLSPGVKRNNLLGSSGPQPLRIFSAGGNDPACNRCRGRIGRFGKDLRVSLPLRENLATDLEEYGSRVEVVTAEQIQNGGFADASQALQMLVPGLTILPKNGAFDYVNASLLGGRKQDVIWLVDGVRISNRLYTTTTPLDTIPANMIERIEVIKGGQSLFYGTSAISGLPSRSTL